MEVLATPHKWLFYKSKQKTLEHSHAVAERPKPKRLRIENEDFGKLAINTNQEPPL